MDDLFEVPGTPWVPVSPALARLRHELLLGGLGLAAIAVVIVGGVFLSLGLPITLAGLATLVVAGLAGWRLVTRNAASWAYAERDDDLFVRRGVAFRRIEIVPYGRMQFVDVTTGPLQRLHGLATVRLHTASPSTSAVIPGLPPDDAARLRDRLTERGQAQAAGL